MRAAQASRHCTLEEMAERMRAVVERLPSLGPASIEIPVAVDVRAFGSKDGDMRRRYLGYAREERRIVRWTQVRASQQQLRQQLIVGRTW